MKRVMQTTSGQIWNEVQSVEEAFEIGKVTETAFGYFFRMDKSRPNEAQHLYFALGDNYEVIGCVPVSPPPYAHRAQPAHGSPLFVAHRNGNPFALHGGQISELAKLIGADVTEACYPYRGSGLDMSNEDEGDGPSPS